MHEGTAGLARLLPRIEIFKNLNASEARAIAGQCNWHRYDAGKQVLSEKEMSSDVFFVIEGEVDARSYSPKGREVSFSIISAGGIFGEFSAIDNLARSAAVVTTEPSGIASLTAVQFRDMLLQFPDVHLCLSRHLIGKIRDLSQRVFEISTLTLRNRLVAELRRLCNEAGVTGTSCVIDPAPTRYAIATRIASHREAVSREINKLAAEGIVKLKQRRIEIPDTRLLV